MPNMKWPYEPYWPAAGAAEHSKRIIGWTIIAVAVPIAGAVVWWITENSLNRLAPYQVGSATGLFSSAYSLLLCA